MAYSAALDDRLDAYFDTRLPTGVVAHPLFAVCPEWPVIVESRDALTDLGVDPLDVQRGVHATHDLTVHRLIRPDDVLTTTMTVVGVEQRSPGAFASMVLKTLDADGAPVATTRQGTLYLDVPTVGPDRPAPVADDPPPTTPADGLARDFPIDIAAGAAHIYTECARIWNPIHTDVAVAEASGLSGIILHGTATLAHAVSTVVREVADGDPHAIRRVSARFGAMVLMPSTIVVRILGQTPIDGARAVHFEVRNAQGAAAVDRGVIVVG